MRYAKKETGKKPAKIVKVKMEFRIPGTSIIAEEGDDLEIYPADTFDNSSDLPLEDSDDDEFDDPLLGESEDGDEEDEDNEDNEDNEDKKESSVRFNRKTAFRNRR